MDLFDHADAGDNAPELTVSEISGAVKRVIEGEFGRVRVRGEVGRVSRPRSGHLYFDLKDARAVLAAVTWRGVAAGLAHQPAEGMEVVATGRLTTFAGQSRYQLIVEDIRPAGLGALMLMLEQRKAALAAEGLFDAARKRPIPFLPDVIGVITSPSGAVIRDILHRLAERFPRPVLVWPVPVQGAASAPAVAAAIRGFNALPPHGPIPRPDVLIVARGGGSIEDLWGFNEEAVVRAAAASAIPLISAVGHETDTTLIDFAADRRAPTPTAAAEMAVPVRLDLLSRLAGLEDRRTAAQARAIALRAQRLRDLARALPRPEALTAEAAQRLDTAALRLPAALGALVQARRLRLAGGAGGRMDARLLSVPLARKADRLTQTAARLAAGPVRLVARAAERLADRGGRLRPAPLSRRIAADRDRLARLETGLSRAINAAVAARRDRLAGLGRILASLDYHQVLGRGFALVRDGHGSVLTRAEAIARAPAIEIEMADGRVAARPARPDA